MTDFDKIRSDTEFLLTYRGDLSVDALRAIYALHCNCYCGEYSDGESNPADFKWACERSMAKDGVKPSPRNWTLAATKCVPHPYVWGEY